MGPILTIHEQALDSLGVVGRIVLDAEARIIQTNAATARWLGFAVEELIGQRFTSLLPTACSADWHSWWLCPEETTSQPVLLHLQTRDGELRSLRCVILHAGEVRVLLAATLAEEDAALRRDLVALNNELANLMRDNARKSRDLARALEELKQTQTVLVEREKLAALGQMTAGVAHELNNPLAFVTNNETVLLRDFEDLLEFVNSVGGLLDEPGCLPPATRQHILEQAANADLATLAESIPRKLRDNREGLARIRSIVQDLRAQTRLDEAEWKACDLVPGLEATVRFLGPLCLEHQVTIETRLDPLGPVTCAPAALNQAVNIVLTNAVQASGAGQVVLLSLTSSHHDVVIEVSDAGAGIPAEHLGRVFEPFFTTKGVGQGMGLGLGIARHIIEQHRGRIEIESAVGRGTSVRLIFPRRDPAREGG